MSKAGYEVYLVAKGESYSKNGVQVVGIGEAPGSRLNRMTRTAGNIYKAAVNIDADIYHLQDPELLPHALKLKKMGKLVIFDSHEDYLLTLEKRWIPDSAFGDMALPGL